jgi:hypothetical protein
MNVPSVCRLHLSAAALGALTLAWSASSFAQDPAPKAVKNILLVHGFRAIPPTLEQAMAQTMDAYIIHVRSSQLVMLSHPEVVVQLIDQATGGE